MTPVDPSRTDGLQLEPPAIPLPDDRSISAWRGRFNDDGLEAAYQETLSLIPEWVRRFALAGVVLWGLAGITDPWLDGAPGWPRFWLWRYGSFLVNISIVMSIRRPLFQKGRWRYGLITTVLVVGLVLAAIPLPNPDAAVGAAIGIGLITCIMIVYIMALVSWRTATMAAVPFCLAYLARLYQLGASTPVFAAAALCVGLNVLVAALICALLEDLRRQSFADNLAIDWERHRSDRVLANALPESVAAALRAGDPTAARHHDEVCVLFADIVGFTPLAATLSAPALVARLDRIFSAFDEEASQLGLTKIKTIGDAYMAVAGAPEPHPSGAAAIATFALRMIERLRELEGDTMQLRVGLHRGPISAGVIGTQRFAYDLWGDTVNLASRLESHGVPGRVQVSREVVDALGEAWSLEPRGTVELKGRGPVETWFLTDTPPDA